MKYSLLPTYHSRYTYKQIEDDLVSLTNILWEKFHIDENFALCFKIKRNMWIPLEEQVWNQLRRPLRDQLREDLR